MATEVIDRSAFIRRWRDRKGGEDPFDQFFSLWLALVICARPKLQPQDYDKMDTDRCAVLIVAKEAHEAIFRELVSCKDELAWLAQRRGTRRKDPVVDVYDFRRAAHLRSLFGILAEHYSGKKEAKSGRVVEAVIELLNHVRNNLFHGIKDPNDVDDRELVLRLNTVLRAVLKGVGH